MLVLRFASVEEQKSEEDKRFFIIFCIASPLSSMLVLNLSTR